MDEESFLEKGYDIVEAEDMDKLNRLRDAIFHKAKEIVDYKGDNAEELFNHFHNYKLQGVQLNEKRMEIIKWCNQNLETGKTVYEIFSNSITQLIGPDVVTQKNTNIVIQQPGDMDIAATHRDSPLNSHFEIIVWLPLVDIYGTKSMYILNLKKSLASLELLKDTKTGYKDFNKYAIEHGENVTIPYGKALLFWPGLAHGSHVNKEKETRWALNMRYKNIFSPCGPKGLTEFFDLLRLSPLAKIAFDYERQMYG